MPKGLQQTLAVLFSLLLSLSPLSAASDLIGSARVSGQVHVNGVALPDGTNLYSGDEVTTEDSAHLTLVPSTEERIHLLPRSSARLSKSGEITKITLDQGTVNFRSRGYIRAVLEQHGVEIRATDKSSTIFQIALSNPGQAQITTVHGSVEVRAPVQVVHLNAGDKAVMASASTEAAPAVARRSGSSAAAQEERKADVGSVTGTVADARRTAISAARVTLTNKATGASRTTETNAAGTFDFGQVSPGSYNLEISSSGFQTYEMKDLVVQPGRESSLGLIMLERGGGKKAMIAVAVIGGAGAAIAIPLILQDDEEEVVSPAAP